ncbi:MAG: ABC transporter permease [Phycisphaerales bacterium]|nr:MAG: ABC transporter permease [Phycisphaerales bacterium]
MRILWQDMRYGLRQLRKSPGFTAVAVLSLALGIGANTAIFSAINGILYKSLPVRNPHELRQIIWTTRTLPKITFLEGGYSRTKSGGLHCGSFQYQTYLDFAEQARGFSDVFAFSNYGEFVTISAGGLTSRAYPESVSGNFFQSYGAEVMIGRPITPEDDRPDAPPVALITYRLWQRVFGLDPHVIGRTFTVRDTIFTIIGVLPRHYVAPLVEQQRVDFYVPLVAQPRLMYDLYKNRWLDFWWVRIMGRLAPGADEAQVQASLEVLFDRTLRRSEVEVDQPRILLEEGLQGVLGSRQDAAGPFWLMLYVVGLVLLIACTNLAGLLLARGAVRQHEMAVRAAMGAGRWRLIRQSLTESLILSLGGVCLGLLLSAWLRGILSSCILDLSDSGQFNLRIDTNVLMFALGTGVVTTLLSGLFPALRASHADPLTGLKDAGSYSAPRLRLGKVLVTAQVSMSVLFVMVGGLLCRTLANLYRMDPGFVTENLLLVPIDPGNSLFPPRDERFFFDSVREKIAAIPGVRSVALSNTTLTGGRGWVPEVSIPGRPEVRPRKSLLLSVSEGYFATLGINLLQGRDFCATDTEDSQRIVIVNEEFARLFFPEKNPLGQFIAMSGFEGEEYQIVGLCGNHIYCGLREDTSPILYTPHSQFELSNVTCMIRSVLEPLSLVPAVRKAVAEIDRNLPLEGITTQKLAIKESLRLERLFTSLIGSFALLALVLCCIGLYGMLAYNVARRTGEMGIRKALGARSWDVAWPILRGALTLAAIGVATGLPISLALGCLMRSLFYGIEPHDPLTMIGTVGIMVAVAVLAAWIPARRAARIDPMEALRYE